MNTTSTKTAKKVLALIASTQYVPNCIFMDSVLIRTKN